MFGSTENGFWHRHGTNQYGHHDRQHQTNLQNIGRRLQRHIDIRRYRTTTVVVAFRSWLPHGTCTESERLHSAGHSKVSDNSFTVNGLVSLNFVIDFRCIHLAQPPLEQNEIDQIETIISIYTSDDANADAMETASSTDSIDPKVYTLEDDVEPTTELKTNQNRTASIWREAPG